MRRSEGLNALSGIGGVQTQEWRVRLPELMRLNALSGIGGVQTLLVPQCG